MQCCPVVKMDGQVKWSFQDFYQGKFVSVSGGLHVNSAIMSATNSSTLTSVSDRQLVPKTSVSDPPFNSSPDVIVC